MTLSEITHHCYGLPKGETQTVKSTSIDLSSLGLTEVPEVVRQFTDLECLWLTDNQIEILPDWIWDFKNLRVFIAKANKIQKLPLGMSKLQNLKTLNVRNNKISELPNDIYECYKLQYVDVSNNKLEALPMFSQVIRLDAHNNNIKRIDTLYVLELEYLNLHKNQIEDFIVAENIRELCFLDIRKNCATRKFDKSKCPNLTDLVE
jgi:leucine-rich repeat protein SHOC2